MKKTAKMQKIVMTALVLGFLFLATTSFAGWGTRMGHGPVSGNTNANLTAEQQQQLDTAREKYSGPLEELQTSLNSKRDAYRSARANDSTTVGTLKQLEAEMTALEQQYSTLLDKANSEAGGDIADGNGASFHCGYKGSDHQNHRGKMGKDHQMGPENMKRMAGHMGDCWRN